MTSLPRLLADVDPAAQTGTPLEPVLFALTLVGVVVLVLGIVLCLYRLLRGPHLADRVLSADTLAVMVVGLVILLGIRLETTVFLDAALVVSILGFASTVAFAQYIGARFNPREDA